MSSTRRKGSLNGESCYGPSCCGLGPTTHSHHAPLKPFTRDFRPYLSRSGALRIYIPYALLTSQKFPKPIHYCYCTSEIIFSTTHSSSDSAVCERALKVMVCRLNFLLLNFADKKLRYKRGEGGGFVRVGTRAVTGRIEILFSFIALNLGEWAWACFSMYHTLLPFMIKRKNMNKFEE